MKNEKFVKESSSKRNVGRHYNPWVIIRAQEMIVFQSNFISVCFAIFMSI